MDSVRCTACGVCEELAPELLLGRPVPVSARALDVMAECPVGAVVWREPEETRRESARP